MIVTIVPGRLIELLACNNMMSRGPTAAFGAEPIDPLHVDVVALMYGPYFTRG